MSPHKPSSSHTSKSPFWHGGIKSALSSAISIFQPNSSRPRPPATAQILDTDQPQQDQDQAQTTEPLPLPLPALPRPPSPSLPPLPVPTPAHLPMASSPPTPGGDPTHSTYEVNVPVRNARTSEPKVSNPEIRIPRITPVSDSTDQPPQSQSQPQEQSQPQSQPQPQSSTPPSKDSLLQQLAAGLDGKYVDEFGNILDWDGTVLGRVEGDLPSMVGRPVMPSGEILDQDGELAGHVCDNYIKPDLKPLAGGLKVDDEGNIYNDQGIKIGKLDQPINDGPEKLSGSKDSNADQGQGQGSAGTNAPKPPAPPRPDELFLDVKSTYDGIQLVIKIPTVFNRNLVTEKKSIGSQTDATDSSSSSIRSSDN